MKFIISTYNQDTDWAKKYSDDIVIYDRSYHKVEGSIPVENIGSDIYDKFTYIIDNYDNLPEIAVYTKANLFKYITPQEFEEKLKTGKFEPLLTKEHDTYMPVCFYHDGMYNEINDRWYMANHTCKHLGVADELFDLLGLTGKEYLEFAPGSNYILKKENILQRSKEFYQKLRSYLEHDVYPGEAQIMERGLYYLWKK